MVSQMEWMGGSVGGVGKNQIDTNIEKGNYTLWSENSVYTFQKFHLSVRAMVRYNAPRNWRVLKMI